jgi:hypothetical protein
MKQRKFLLGFAALFCSAALFLGCPTDPEDEEPNYGGEVKALPPVSLLKDEGTKYYSLSTGEEVTGNDIHTNKWDIAFLRTRLILTNSGDTATKLESDGAGGVWYTEKTELSKVSSDDKKGGDHPILKDYITDQKRYTSTGMLGATEQFLNVMSYVGYRNEEEKDGKTAENYLGNKADDPSGTMPYLYNKKQFYDSVASHGESNTGPTLVPSNQVYIIRHGDGKNYSKIKINYESTGTMQSGIKDNWLVLYQNF